MTEAEQRLAVVNEAKKWIGTPYHHAGRVQGAGVDCGMLLCEVYERAGMVGRIDPPYYPPDWHLHRSEERYLGWVEKFAKRTTEPGKPGDIVAFLFGRCFSHGAIVIEWPICLHAYLRHKVGYVDLEHDLEFSKRKRLVYTLWS